MFEREIEIYAEKSALKGSSVKIVQENQGSESVVVWDAALVLAHFLQIHPEQLTGVESAVELGSGTGCVGLVAKACLPEESRVILSDLEQYLDIIRENIRINGFDKVLAKEIRWGREEDIRGLSPDLILISDCVYYEDSLEPLVKTLSGLSSNGGKTRILMSYEKRFSEQKIKVENSFFELIKKNNFSVKEFPSSECHPDFSCDDIKVILMRKTDLQ